MLSFRTYTTLTLFVISILTVVFYMTDMRYVLRVSHDNIIEHSITLQQRNTGLRGAELSTISIHPTNPNKLIVQGLSGGYVSFDGGKQWKPITLWPDTRYKALSRLFWSDAGMLTTLWYGRIRWSKDGVIWKSKGTGKGDWILGQTCKHRMWLKSKDTKPTTHQWLDWDKDGKITFSNASTNETIAKKCPPKAAFPKWSISKFRVWKQTAPNTPPVTSDKGIHRPPIRILIQNQDNPRQVAAISASARGLFRGETPEGLQRYIKRASHPIWLSQDFGQHWKPAPTRTLLSWSMKPQHRARCSHLDLKRDIQRFAPTGKVGWLSDTHYFLLNTGSLQIGRTGTSCKQTRDHAWEWSHRNLTTKLRYEIGFHSIIEHYDKSLPRRIRHAGPDSFVLRQHKGHVEFLITGAYGGLWGGRVPLKPGTSLQSLLHTFMNTHGIIVLWMLALFGIYRKKQKQAKDTPQAKP
jgi:hypothetical protein